MKIITTIRDLIRFPYRLLVAHREAKTLARAIAWRHYAKTAPHWEVDPDPVVVIHQISNMTAGLGSTKADLRSLMDWAESIMCNGKPASHCTQEEWDRIVRNWRDAKHAALPDGAPPA